MKQGWKPRQFLRKLRMKKVKLWHLVIALIVMSLLSAFFLRQNNLKMIKLRQDVITADEHNHDLAAALAKLNNHVFHHMNTEIVRPIELVHSYNRAVERAVVEASKQSGRDIYAEAQVACEQRGVPVAAIAQCAADYAMNHNTGGNLKKISMPDKNRFTYNYAAPLWTPDLAGFSILITGVILIWLVLRAIELITVKIIIRRRIRQQNF